MHVVEKLKSIIGIGIIVHETTEGSNCTGACILRWKLAFAAFLVIEGLFFGHVIYVVRRATRQSVGAISVTTHVGHAISAGVFFATGMLHILPEAISLMSGGEHGTMHREGDHDEEHAGEHAEEHAAHEDDVEGHSEGHGKQFPWVYFIVLVGFYALFFIEKILIPKIFSALPKKNVPHLPQVTSDRSADTLLILPGSEQATVSGAAPVVDRSGKTFHRNNLTLVSGQAPPSNLTNKVSRSDSAANQTNLSGFVQETASESGNPGYRSSRSMGFDQGILPGTYIDDGGDESSIPPDLISNILNPVTDIIGNNLSEQRVANVKVTEAGPSDRATDVAGLGPENETDLNKVTMPEVEKSSNADEIQPCTMGLTKVNHSRVREVSPVGAGPSCIRVSTEDDSCRASEADGSRGVFPCGNLNNNNEDRMWNLEVSQSDVDPPGQWHLDWRLKTPSNMTPAERNRRLGRHLPKPRNLQYRTMRDVREGTGIPVIPKGEGFYSAVFLTALLQVIGIAAHSLFESIALGLSSDFPTLLNVFIATAAHRWATSLAISFSISTKLAYFPFLVVFALFSVMVPIGVGIGIAAHGLNSLVQGILFSLSAATFLYIGAFEVMAYEFVARRGAVGSKFFFVLVGAGLISLITALLVALDIGH